MATLDLTSLPRKSKTIEVEALSVGDLPDFLCDDQSVEAFVVPESADDDDDVAVDAGTLLKDFDTGGDVVLSFTSGTTPGVTWELFVTETMSDFC